MRVEIKKLCEKLGVDRILAPYETQPWAYYDSERGLTCSAEARMNPNGDELEAEIQFVYDEGREPPPEPVKAPPPTPLSSDILAPPPPPPPKPEGNGGRTYDGGPIQILFMRADPIGDKIWSPRELRVKGKSYVNKIHNWEEKGCDFFRSCIEALQMGIIPNIEELIERELDDDDGGGGGRRGRIGRKAPKIKPAQVLGMKKGM
jgi:hypothetical protein